MFRVCDAYHRCCDDRDVHLTWHSLAGDHRRSPAERVDGSPHLVGLFTGKHARTARPAGRRLLEAMQQKGWAEHGSDLFDGKEPLFLVWTLNIYCSVSSLLFNACNLQRGRAQ